MNRALEEKTESVSTQPHLVPRKGSHRRFRRKWLLAGAIVLALIVTIPVILLARNWPFSRQNVLQDLADATSSTVEVRNFRNTYFPHPGCIAEGITFRRARNPQSPPLMTMQRLTIVGSFLGLLTKRVPLMRAEGMRVFVLPLGTGESWPQSKSQSSVVISKFVTEGAMLEFLPREASKRPFTFAVHEFSIDDLGSQTAMRFKTRISNPTPPGEISASGTLGPWRQSQPAQIPVSGTYSFQRADLGVFHGIGGILSSDGKISGTLSQIQVQGATITPDFEVARSGHRFRLATKFRALVNGSNGDVTLQDVHAQFWNSTVVAQGSVAGNPGRKGKTTSVNLAARQGRIEDILFMFVHEPRSPLLGNLSFIAKTTIPPGQGPFLRKVRLEGDFGIDDATFTNFHTQDSIEKLSERGRGEKEDQQKKEDPERVLSDLKGHIVLKDGTATFTNLSFTVPGALAHVHGTFDLISQRIDLRGTLQLQVKLSDATSGVKSFLIKALDPFTNNNKPGIPLPISITGTYHHPVYRISASPKK
jgi:AsmA-like protein